MTNKDKDKEKTEFDEFLEEFEELLDPNKDEESNTHKEE
jgi:hypothetical protein